MSMKKKDSIVDSLWTDSFAFSFLGSWATACQMEGLTFRTGFEGWNVAVKKYLANSNQLARMSTAFSTVMMDR